MKKLLAVLSILSALPMLGAADTSTTRAGVIKPTIGSSGWGAKVNLNYDIIDSSFSVLSINEIVPGVKTFTSSMTVTSSGTFTNEAKVGSLKFAGDGTVLSSSASIPSLSSSNTFTLQQTVPSLKFSGDSTVLSSTAALASTGTANTFAQQQTVPSIKFSGDGSVQSSTSGYVANQSYLQAGSSFYVLSGTTTRMFTSTIQVASTATVQGAIVANGTAGTSGQVLTSQGNNASPQWTTTSVSAGGSNTQVQYNSGGTLAGTTNFIVWASSTEVHSLRNGTVSNDAAAYGQLTYLQAPVQFTMTTTTSTTVNTYTATGLKATITPSSTSSRVKIQASFDLSTNTPASADAIVTLKRGTTDLAGGANGFAFADTADQAASFTYIDSPNTTSATTYELFLRNDNNTFTVNLGRSGVTSVIILDEVR